QITSFGGGTQYTEDAAAAADPVGTALIMVRDDALSGQTTTDGDNVAARGTDKGELYVKHADNITVALGAVDNAVLDAIAASVAAIDTDATTIIGHVDGIETALAAANASLDAIEASAAAIDTDTSSLLTELQLKADLTETQPVSLATVPSHAVTNAGTFAVQTGAERAEDTAHTTGDTGLFILGVMNEGEATIAPTQGDYAPIAVNETGQVMVEVRNSVVVAPAGGSSFTVANAGTFPTQVDGAALTALQLIDNIVGSINGPGAPVIDSYQSIAINLAAAANQSLVAAPGVSKQIWVYGLAFTVNVAGTVSFQDEDDVALSGIMQVGITGGMVVAPSGNFAMPLWKLATNKALEVDVVTAELDGTLTYGVVSV
ncbi:MAG: hypothetical protein U0990_07800, partial [Candidatus Nanopelagicales bacterium]|nr:hypothetical protein [Candidatus Nanopelagicales bacterium]